MLYCMMLINSTKIRKQILSLTQPYEKKYQTFISYALSHYQTS